VKEDTWATVEQLLERRKRTKSPPNNNVAVEEQSSPMTDGTDQAMDIDPPTGASVLSFRDGEHHVGEGPLDEIIAGFNDGELSDKCVVYLVKEDTWVSVEQLLERRKRAKGDVNGAVEVAKVEDSSPDTMDLDVNVVGGGNVRALRSGGSGKSKVDKKQARDSSSWGANPPPRLPLPHGAEPVENERPTDANKNDGTPDSQNTPTVVGSDASVPMSNKQRKSQGRTKPPAKLMRYITQAMIQWDMLENGDRLLLGLSGGKDSLSLLHCLLEFQRKLPIKFEIEVCTIDPMTPSFDPSPLIPYVESLGLKYHYIKDDIVTRANSSGKNGKVVSSLCAFCARMKRGNLYSCARDNNCNKLVLAQHLDDCAESFLMSMMHNGFVRTMKASYKINAGDISVIRPLVYARESLLTDFAASANLPVINENCPACFEEPKERARIKQLLSREETLFPNLYDNLRRALIPIMHDDSTAILRCYTEEAVAKSRKIPNPGGKEKEKMKMKGRKHGRENSGGDGRENGDGGNGVSVVRSVAEEGAARVESGAAGAVFSLSDLSDDDLVKELARRKAERHKLSGAMKKVEWRRKDDIVDPTGQVCTLDGSGGTITCRDLME